MEKNKIKKWPRTQIPSPWEIIKVLCFVMWLSQQDLADSIGKARSKLNWIINWREKVNTNRATSLWAALKINPRILLISQFECDLSSNLSFKKTDEYKNIRELVNSKKDSWMLASYWIETEHELASEKNYSK